MVFVAWVFYNYDKAEVIGAFSTANLAVKAINAWIENASSFTGGQVRVEYYVIDDPESSRAVTSWYTSKDDEDE